MFYMTYARSRPDFIIPYCENHNIPLMSNVAYRWSESKDTFLEPYDYDTHHVIDSGGYNIQKNYGEYPWTVQQYHNLLKKVDIDWAAVMDYACEERFDDLHSVQKRMQKTVDNTIKHICLNPSYNLLPVLQGRSIEDYIDSYDMLRDHGIECNHVGLGTVCRISSSQEIEETEKAIRDKCKNVEKIHGFGVKIDAFKMDTTFDSADSNAWAKAPTYKQCYVDEGHRLGKIDMPDNSYARTIGSFRNYYRYANRLFESGKNGHGTEKDIDGYKCCYNPSYNISKNGLKCETCDHTKPL